VKRSGILHAELSGAAAIVQRLPAVYRVPHTEFKLRTAATRLVVRTGEATPFANVLRRCGVPF
jgi:D-ribose pyranase